VSGRYEGYENSWEKACLYAQKVVLKIYMYKGAARERKGGFTGFIPSCATIQHSTLSPRI